MKKFFSKIKTDIKFARAGEGHKLTEDTRTYPPARRSSPRQPENVRDRPSSSSQMRAGAAAAARHEDRAKQTKTVVPKVIRAKPQADLAETSSTEKDPGSSKPKVAQSAMEDSILFHSPFTDEIVPKAELKVHVREHLILGLSEDAVQASSLMITSLNKDKDKMQAAIETIYKYIENIVSHPGEVKYTKIRRNNRIFSEKVAPIQGCEEFLEAVGFKRTLESTGDGAEEEIFFVLWDFDVDKLKEAKETLSCAQIIDVHVYRDPKIIMPAENFSVDFELSKDFFKLTPNEVKKEQQQRTEEVVVSKQLRTREMREAGRTVYKYNYAFVKVKFPNEQILQGTFRARETVGDLNSFIREHINVQWAVFTLRTAMGDVIESEDATLLSADLVPSATLNLSWNEEIRREILEQQGVELSLKTKTE